MSKEKLIPDLRFPEFKNEGEWEVKELSELGDLINGLTYSPDDVSDKGLLVLRSSNIQNGMIDLKDCVYVKEDVKGANLSIPSDILVCVRNGSKNLIGKNAIIPKGLPLATHGAFMTVFRAVNPEFVFQLFQTDYYDTQVKADLGATINSINGKNFLKYEFPVPENPKEQQKIATCLSSLDEVIAAHSQKLELLKDHKKGLMQNLFPQEGEQVPKYRFKEFEKEWERVKLKDVSTYFNGGSYENDVKEEGKYQLITLKSINKYGQLVDSNRYIDVEVSTLRKGTLVMILSEQAPGLLGMTALIPENNKFVLNQRVAEIRPNQKVISFFLSMAINRNQTYFSKQGAGMKVQNITKPNVENYGFLVPEISEQQKIASCLSSLDALITAQAEKIEQLKLHKKGLMQGLFPKSITN